MLHLITGSQISSRSVAWDAQISEKMTKICQNEKLRLVVPHAERTPNTWVQVWDPVIIIKFFKYKFFFYSGT